jgi:hypothetical protein
MILYLCYFLVQLSVQDIFNHVIVNFLAPVAVHDSFMQAFDSTALLISGSRLFCTGRLLCSLFATSLFLPGTFALSGVIVFVFL